MLGERILPEGVGEFTIKNAVTIAKGNAVILNATDNEIDLPGGTGSTAVIGVALAGGVGSTANPVKIDVAVFGCVVRCVAAAAIAAGLTVVTNSTTGKVSAATTAGAILGRALSNASGDGVSLWVAVGRA